MCPYTYYQLMRLGKDKKIPYRNAEVVTAGLRDCYRGLQGQWTVRR